MQTLKALEYLEGSRNLVSRLILGTVRVTIWVHEATLILRKSLDPASKVAGQHLGPSVDHYTVEDLQAQA